MLTNVADQDISEILLLIKISILACEADHHNDAMITQRWLANKTTENLTLWLKQNNAIIFRKNNQILGVLMWSKQGEILLNYVLPKFQQQGIGKKY